ncbi:hypothetical protein LCGC14_2431000 [marine sediment metagenome]|uniref:Uncharacterized protein n=1 Tax=marine sediment metagenome TaxID=412755 RepID=A0A0F9EFV9_9ZZZZ
MGETNTIRFVMAGAHAGKTIKLGKYQFVDGVYEYTGTPGGSGGAARYLRKSYQAFPEGSIELKIAQERYQELLEETSDGKCDSEESSQPDPTESVSSDVSSSNGWNSEEDPTDDGGSDDAETGDSGFQSEGDGVCEGREEADSEE